MARGHVLAWLGVALLAQSVSGQVLDPSIAVLPGDPITVRWDGSDVAQWTIRNDGDTTLTVSLDLDEAGWKTDFPGKYGDLMLAAGASTVVTARVEPGSASRANATSYPVMLSVTGTDAAGRTDAASASVPVLYLAQPVIAPPPPPPPDTTLRDVSIGTGIIAGPIVVAYVAAGFLYRVQVPRQPVSVRGTRGAWIHITVRNLAPWDQTIQVQVRSPGPTWQVAGDADRVTVRRWRSETYTVYVRRLRRADARRTRIYVRARRAAVYPWLPRGAIVAAYEPVDLEEWSAQSIGEAMQEAGMNGAAPDGFGGPATLGADLRSPDPSRRKARRPRPRS